MVSHKIKIAARLRPRLENELDDGGIQITHTPGDSSYITVLNPRDLSQIFNFPLVTLTPQSNPPEQADGIKP